MMLQKLYTGNYSPLLLGGGGLTLANISPDPNDVSKWVQVIIGLSTVVTQIITLLKRKKSNP